MRRPFVFVGRYKEEWVYPDSLFAFLRTVHIARPLSDFTLRQEKLPVIGYEWSWERALASVYNPGYKRGLGLAGRSKPKRVCQA